MLGGVKRVGELGRNDFLAQLRLTRLAGNRAAIDYNVGEISEHLLGSVLACDEREELRGVVDEGSPCQTTDECGVRQDTEEELMEQL